MALPPTKQKPTVSYATPMGDVVFFELVDITKPEFSEPPAFGTPHKNTTKWPHHKFAWSEPIDQENLQRWTYVADRGYQHLYNWTFNNARDWPAVTQLFLIPRADFDPEFRDYAPPPPEIVPLDGFSVTSVQATRTRQEFLDSLYVAVEVTRERISDLPMVGYVLDPDTNEARRILREKVPVGTEGTPVNSNGVYSEITPINEWVSLRTTRSVAGLAGAETKTRTYYIITNYTWPAVLSGISFFGFPNTNGSINSYAGIPVYSEDAYNGPCVTRVTETWTQTAPTVNDLATAMTTLFPKAIRFPGNLLRVDIPACLHGDITLYESPGTNHPTLGYYYFSWFFEATTDSLGVRQTTWPDEITASYSVTPAFGGYLTKQVDVLSPRAVNALYALQLSQTGSDPATVTMRWSQGAALKEAAAGDLKLQRATNISFTANLVSVDVDEDGSQDVTVSGLSTNTTYYFRMRTENVVGLPNPSFGYPNPPEDLLGEYAYSNVVTVRL